MNGELQESPEYVRLSLAAAMTLRLASGRFYRDARLHCVNLLLTYSNGCVGKCSYCGLSGEREGRYEEKSFIRVAWPVYRLATVAERLNKYAPWVERVCISMVTNKRAIEDTIAITRQLKQVVDLPVSLLISPTIVAEQICRSEVTSPFPMSAARQTLQRFKDAGAEMIGVAIDMATEGLFEHHRGKGVNGPHSWEKYWQVLQEAVDVFGQDKAGSHLIVGLGETEQEMIETIQRVRDMGARTHLFSFHPESGSLLEDKPSCDIGQYRRVQLARWLIDHKLSRKEQMEFDQSGRITGFGLEKDQLDEIIRQGKPFQTSGCPGRTMEGACNRPFGDGPPSDIRSFPFELNDADVEKIRKEMSLSSGGMV